MVYRILKIIAQICFSVYHRKVYFIDRENLPDEGPVLLSLNHPGAFFDACIMGAFARRPIYFLTRGDFFKPGFVTWFLVATHQIPIFRASDGMRNLRANMDTFSRCFDYLNDGKVVLIFPEAATALVKHLRPLHKGVARIAFGAHDRFPGTIPKIVPVGVTFSEPREFGRDAFFRFGQPITIDDKFEQYERDSQIAYQQVLDELDVSLRQLMIHLDNERGEKLFDRLVVLLEEIPAAFPGFSESDKAWSWQRSLGDRINVLSETELSDLEASLDEIQNTSEKHGLPLHILPRFLKSEVSALWVLLTAPFLFAGRLIEVPPAWFTGKFILSKIRREPFIAPMKSILGFAVHLIYFGLILAILAIAAGWKGVLIAGFIVMLAYFSLTQHRSANLVHWINWISMNKGKQEKLRNDVNAIGTRLYFRETVVSES